MTDVAIPASVANCKPPAEGLLEITRSMRTSSWLAAIFSIRFLSVVPPPEINTAKRSGLRGGKRKVVGEAAALFTCAPFHSRTTLT